MTISGSARRASEFRKGAWQRAFDWIFGYDLFISYSRIGWDERYAVDLAERLSRPLYDFKSFLDANVDGDRWQLEAARPSGSTKIFRNHFLTPGVLQSPGVRHELESNRFVGLETEAGLLV